MSKDQKSIETVQEEQGSPLFFYIFAVSISMVVVGFIGLLLYFLITG